MRNLNFELKQLCRRNRDGSYATQRDRERVLNLVAGQLQELGYRHMAAANLKAKHVEGLAERWQAEGLRALGSGLSFPHFPFRPLAAGPFLSLS